MKKRHYEEHKSKVRLIRTLINKRSVLQSEQINTLTSTDWEECKKYFDYCCAYCGKHTHALTKDHVIALSKGGNMIKQNIIPVCRSCNSSKGNRSLSKWYKLQKFYDPNREKKIFEYIKSTIAE